MKQMLILMTSLMIASTAQAKIIGAKSDPAQAAALNALVATADKTFPRVPNVRFKKSLKGQCGADMRSNPYVLFCASTRQIFMRTQTVSDLGANAAAYLLAHVYGHAAQVNYGVADIALATIRANRAEEPKLRGFVTRQVECVAGVLNKRAGMQGGGPAGWFASEPLVDSHWGATPLARGPVVSIGLAQRDAWFRKGLKSGDFASCSAGVFPADLLVKAAR